MNFTTKKGNQYTFKILKKIKDFPNYLASKNGNIYSVNYRGHGKFKRLKLVKSKIGYLVVSLCNNGKVKQYKVHRLVAITFIDNKENKPCINHLDGNKKNNVISNLEWCTVQENTQHSYDNGLQKRAKNCLKRSKPVKGVNIKTGEEISFESTQEAGRNGFDNGHISKCCKGVYKQHKGYIWTYI